MTINELLNEKRRLTPALAAPLAKLLNASAVSWLAMQAAPGLGNRPAPRERLWNGEPLRESV